MSTSPTSRVTAFSGSPPAATWWTASPPAGPAGGQFNSPIGVAVGPWGDVYVVDSVHQRVQRFGSAGEFLGGWGARGSDPGDFRSPSGIAVDGAGNVYVSDLANHRVDRFTRDGDFIPRWGN